MISIRKVFPAVDRDNCHAINGRVIPGPRDPTVVAQHATASVTPQFTRHHKYEHYFLAQYRALGCCGAPTWTSNCRYFLTRSKDHDAENNNFDAINKRLVFP